MDTQSIIFFIIFGLVGFLILYLAFTSGAWAKTIIYLYRVPRHRHGRKYEDFPKCGMYFDVLYDNKRFSSEDFKLTDKLSTGCTVNLYLDRSVLEARKKRKTLQYRKETTSITNYYIDLNSVEPAK